MNSKGWLCFGFWKCKLGRLLSKWIELFLNSSIMFSAPFQVGCQCRMFPLLGFNSQDRWRVKLLASKMVYWNTLSMHTHSVENWKQLAQALCLSGVLVRTECKRGVSLVQLLLLTSFYSSSWGLTWLLSKTKPQRHLHISKEVIFYYSSLMLQTQQLGKRRL